MANWSRLRFRFDRPIGPIAALAGAATSVGLSLALVPARGWLGNTNVAMLLVGVVIAAAALGGRSAGVLTALVAALTFNAAHTVPYGTLVVEDRRDAITTIFVALVGVGVGELTHRRLAAARQARRRDYAISRLHRIGELTHRSGSVGDVIRAIEDEIGAELGLGAVEFETGPPHKLRPQLRHNGVLDSGERIPSDGIDLLVFAGDEPVGHFVLRAGPQTVLTHAGCVAAIAMADVLGAFVARPVGVVDPDTDAVTTGITLPEATDHA